MVPDVPDPPAKTGQKQAARDDPRVGQPVNLRAIDQAPELLMARATNRISRSGRPETPHACAALVPGI